MVPVPQYKSSRDHRPLYGKKMCIRDRVELMVRPAAWDALDALAESWAAWEAKKLDWDAFDSGAGLQPEQNRKGGIYFADKP